MSIVVTINEVGFYMMCGLITTISVVGYTYFAIQDRREARRKKVDHKDE
jgi:hypothetical protein